MKYLGAHIDLSPLAAIPEAAHALGAEAFAFCPSDAKRYSSPAFSESDMEEFRRLCALYGYSADRVLPHASLVINLGSPDVRKLKLSRISLTDQMQRCRSLGLDRLNFHPGAHLKEISEDESLKLVADSINYALDRTEGVTAVIENMAGQGSFLGYSFEQIAFIIERVEDKSRVGVCIDTCHAFSAGYDLSSPEGYERTWAEFGSVIGFNYLKGMHVNDSMRPLAARIDRHASIGKGTLGNDFFARLMADDRIDGIPLILETPDPSLWSVEIDWLKSRRASD